MHATTLWLAEVRACTWLTAVKRVQCGPGRGEILPDWLSGGDTDTTRYGIASPLRLYSTVFSGNVWVLLVTITLGGDLASGAASVTINSLVLAVEC